MALSLYPLSSMLLLLSTSMSLCSILSTSTSMRPLCHEDEKSALFEFKQSFLIKKVASENPSAYPKVASWKNHGQKNDCCLWDGVECDENTGHVISLDLSSSCLYGSINSSSSLFKLVHLQRLNLGDNNFNFSQIPSRLGFLFRLTYLNLSNSLFYGQIPSEITQLSNLTSLDLGRNAYGNYLYLKSFDLRLVQNLTSLEKLDLSTVNISSTMPDVFANLSSLKFLNLMECNLWGLVPSSLTNLAELSYLNLGYNNFSGLIPSSLGDLTKLVYLNLGYNYFSGLIPSSLGNLTKLGYLNLGINKFSGEIPSSLGNLTKLGYLNLAKNKFSGEIPSWLASLTELNELDLHHNNFIHGSLSWLGRQNRLTTVVLAGINLVGQIPSSLRNLTHLTSLILEVNQLTGQIPLWLSNLTQLTSIYLEENEFHGQIPVSLSKLVDLEELNLAYNHLSGPVKLEMFASLKHLTYLHIPANNLSLCTKISVNASLPKFSHLGLGDCNLTEFPDFLRHQDELVYLYLGDNKIQGQIPKWIGNTGKETLSFLFLNNNFFTGFEQSSILSLLSKLQMLNLTSNKLQGPVPIPPPSILEYTISNNSLTGEISPLFCNLSSLVLLDLSYNNLSGIIPQCLGNSSDSLRILNLENNFFHGSIPKSFSNGSSLRMIDISNNQLGGRLPRSLANCRMLQSLDLSGNHLSDTFPFWLGTLPKLEILILRSNQFFGELGSPATALQFPKLRVIDLSYNNFTGILPSEFFQNLSGMKAFDLDHLAYMEAEQFYYVSGYWMENIYTYQIILANRGMYLRYWKIPDIIAAIDLSSNRFQGDIPHSIGTLKMVMVLNISNNSLSGQIPSILGSLTNLESLDLSHNMFSGEIPQQLKKLTFLAYFNVSHNQLVGPIPQGKQFDTFENSSYEGNSGLCGNPLSKKCESSSKDSAQPHPNFEKDGGSNLPVDVVWIIVLIGFGGGLVVGVVVGLRTTTGLELWLLKTFVVGRVQRRLKSRKEERRGS